MLSRGGRRMQLLPFESFIEKTNHAQTVEELMQTFLDTVTYHGFDKMIFCLLSDHQKIGLKAGVGHLRNYANDWMDYYFDQGFDKIDPVISYCYQKQGTFSWREMAERMALSTKQKKCLYGGVEAGLNNGVCAPLWGPHTFAGVGLASSAKKDAVDQNLDLITAYCNHFYIAFMRLHMRLSGDDNNKQVPNITLTPREREILTWVYKGKSKEVIGEIIGISDHGVDYHLRNVYRKLNAHDRICAVSKALSLGLIHP